MQNDRLLIIRFSAMGDVAMMVPVVYSLAKQYPQLGITVVSRPFAENFFGNLLPNIHFIGINPKKEYKGILGLNRLYNDLKAQNFNIIADFHDVLRTQFIRIRFLLAGKKVAHIDKHRSEKKLLISNNKSHFKQLSTSFDNYAEVLSRLGYPVKLEFNSIFADGKGDFSLIKEYIPEKKEDEKWYGIAPFAAHKGKIYPIKKLQEVINILLRKNNNCRIFFFGSGEKEHETISHLIKNRERCIDASKVLHGLKEELILMSHLDTMLSMDSSNMHLASLVNTRVVSIWGATHIYAGFLGWNQKHDDVVEKQENCRPCSVYGNKECRFGDYHCLDIQPEIIAEKMML